MPASRVTLGLAACFALFATLFPAGAFGQETRLVKSMAVAEFESRLFYSNEVVTEVTMSLPPPTIDYFIDPSFVDPAAQIAVGTPVYVQAEAAHCATDPAAVDTTTITIRSKLTGDEETFPAVETGPDTRIFRIPHAVPTSDASRLAVTPGDGILSTVRDDTLIASLLSCGGASAETEVEVEAEGAIFDSETNLPLEGVTVRLLDPATGQPVVVADGSGGTRPVVSVTDSEGRFQFPPIPPGTYRLEVDPIPGYKAVSAHTPAELPASRRIHPDGSFGQTFTVGAGEGAVFFDYPLDPLGGASGNEIFLIRKNASASEAEVGETVGYEVEVRNASGATLNEVTLTDTLPLGFEFLSGTLRVDGQANGAPVQEPGKLFIAVGDVPDGEIVLVSYRVRITPHASEGDGINWVVAETADGIRSNESSARVRIRQGVFTDRGILFGKIFVDRNGSGVQDAGEAGVPGVRFYLEDGTFVVSDYAGRYSLYGLSPRTHVIKLDSTTLPAGFEVTALDPRNALDGNSRFVDLKRGEMHKANFAVRVTREEGETALENRLQSYAKRNRELSLLGESELDRVERVQDDVRHLPATGVVGGGEADDFVAPAPVSAEPTAPVDAAPAEAPVELEEQIHGLDNSLGFIGLEDGEVVPTQQIRVALKGPAQANVDFLVNGESVPGTQLGKKLSDPSRQLEAWEYIGVALETGENRLGLVMKDPFGNERGREEIRVIVPGKLARIVLEVPETDLVADGQTPVPVTVRLADAAGVPVSSQVELLLESDIGIWDVRDLRPGEPGARVFVRGGSAVFDLVPPSDPVRGKIRVSSGNVESTRELAFTPDLRPMLAVGLVEGTINFNGGGLLPASSRDGFEEELRSFAVEGSDGSAAARAAFFLKGKVKGEYLLTAAYDSEKDVRERLFRDIEPDEYYPVYGDDSVRGFDAQSSGRLYVRIDKDRSYLLFGDFTTESESEARALGNYHRSLNGVRHHFENDRVSANAWATHDTTRQVVEEIPADGTSGPYTFQRADGLVNSERVEIITRDRDQRSIIIRTETMQRFVDYEFEPFTGRLLFMRPIPSLDRDLNPISIRITYEVDQGGDEFWTYGADGQVKVHDKVEVGGSFVEDENPLEPFAMQSVNSTVQVTPNTVVVGEYARTDSALEGEGTGQRVEVFHESKRNDLHVFYGETDETFSNPSSVLSAGRMEIGALWGHKLGARDRINSQALWTQDIQTGGIRKGVRTDWAHSFLNGVSLELGGRVSTETADPASATTVGVTPNDVVSLRTRLTTPVPGVEGLSVYGEAENDVIETDKRMLAAGGDYRLSQRTKAYARHEFINALGGPFELNQRQRNHQTVVGLETEYLQDAHLFNEYRAHDAFTGREAEAATGLRNKWLVREGVTVNTTFERVTPFTPASESQESTSATAGVDFHHDLDWRLATRVEGRTSTQSDSFLHTLNYGLRFADDWTWLNRTLYYETDNKGSQVSDRTQARFQTGFAYRQTEIDTFSALMKYEIRFEDGNPNFQSGDLKRFVHILAGDAHYQPVRDWMFSVHYAGKYVDEDWGDWTDTYHAHLLSGRIMYSLNERWDAGMVQSVFFDRDFSSIHYGWGPEVGYTLKQNVRIGAGFNLFGFEDRDFADRNTATGFYLNLRMKFDETSFVRGDRG